MPDSHNVPAFRAVIEGPVFNSAVRWKALRHLWRFRK